MLSDNLNHNPVFIWMNIFKYLKFNTIIEITTLLKQINLAKTLIKKFFSISEFKSNPIEALNYLSKNRYQAIFAGGNYTCKLNHIF